MPETLPVKYYLNHAHELFQFVNEECGHLLNQQHQCYLDGIKLLSQNAQCLLVRCLARKPEFIKLASLNYTEIDNVSLCLAELKSANYLRSANYRDWLKLAPELTKPQLISSLAHTPVKIRSSTNKPALTDHAQQLLSGQERHLLPILESFIVRQQRNVIDYIFFLFFGDLRNRFQQFAMRDLGVMKTRKDAKNVARFDDIAEAKSAFELQQRRRDFMLKPDELKEETAAYLIQSSAIGHNAQETRDRLLLSVGNHLLDDNAAQAIQLWKASKEPAAVEKWVRESYKRFDKKQLEQDLLQIRNSEVAPSTKVFIEDFYARKYQGKRTSLFTDMLRETSTTIGIDEAFINDVEQGVIERYRENNIDAYFTENRFWRILFALTFWDLLFGVNQTQFSEFDRLPTQLKNNSFYSLQKRDIEKCLEEFHAPSSLLARLTKRSITHYGKPTGIFSWSPNALMLISHALNADNAPNIAAVLKRMAMNYAHTKDGYPDLMIIERNSLRFEEIKAPGDVLRPNQLVSINRLRRAGLNVGVTQVNWASNPNQVYAVVDIETTGGRKGGNAITEVAVVKVQNSEVISEWSTLVNPLRHIPAHITRLTGIDNSMVKDAPTFAEVADQLTQQLEGTIFVAHNVGFDYGFIKAAYQTLNQSFKKPKFCTVSNSRKTFPGLRSYSLSALTEHFNIDLTSHHRALSDARATAELLKLIQDSRQQQATTKTG